MNGTLLGDIKNLQESVNDLVAYIKRAAKYEETMSKIIKRISNLIKK